MIFNNLISSDISFTIYNIQIIKNGNKINDVKLGKLSICTININVDNIKNRRKDTLIKQSLNLLEISHHKTKKNIINKTNWDNRVNTPNIIYPYSKNFLILLEITSNNE